MGCGSSCETTNSVHSRFKNIKPKGLSSLFPGIRCLTPDPHESLYKVLAASEKCGIMGMTAYREGHLLQAIRYLTEGFQMRLEGVKNYEKVLEMQRKNCDSGNSSLRASTRHRSSTRSGSPKPELSNIDNVNVLPSTEDGCNHTQDRELCSDLGTQFHPKSNVTFVDPEQPVGSVRHSRQSSGSGGVVLKSNSNILSSSARFQLQTQNIPSSPWKMLNNQVSFRERNDMDEEEDELTKTRRFLSDFGSSAHTANLDELFERNIGMSLITGWQSQEKDKLIEKSLAMIKIVSNKYSEPGANFLLELGYIFLQCGRRDTAVMFFKEVKEMTSLGVGECLINLLRGQGGRGSLSEQQLKKTAIVKFSEACLGLALTNLCYHFRAKKRQRRERKNLKASRIYSNTREQHKDTTSPDSAEPLQHTTTMISDTKLSSEVTRSSFISQSRSVTRDIDGIFRIKLKAIGPAIRLLYEPHLENKKICGLGFKHSSLLSSKEQDPHFSQNGEVIQSSFETPSTLCLQDLGSLEAIQSASKINSSSDSPAAILSENSGTITSKEETNSSKRNGVSIMLPKEGVSRMLSCEAGIDAQNKNNNETNCNSRIKKLGNEPFDSERAAVYKVKDDDDSGFGSQSSVSNINHQIYSFLFDIPGVVRQSKRMMNLIPKKNSAPKENGKHVRSSTLYKKSIESRCNDIDHNSSPNGIKPSFSNHQMPRSILRRKSNSRSASLQNNEPFGLDEFPFPAVGLGDNSPCFEGRRNTFVSPSPEDEKDVLDVAAGMRDFLLTPENKNPAIRESDDTFKDMDTSLTTNNIPQNQYPLSVFPHERPSHCDSNSIVDDNNKIENGEWGVTPRSKGSTDEDEVNALIFNCSERAGSFLPKSTIGEVTIVDEKYCYTSSSISSGDSSDISSDDDGQRDIVGLWGGLNDSGPATDTLKCSSREPYISNQSRLYNREVLYSNKKEECSLEDETPFSRQEKESISICIPRKTKLLSQSISKASKCSMKNCVMRAHMELVEAIQIIATLEHCRSFLLIPLLQLQGQILMLTGEYRCATRILQRCLGIIRSFVDYRSAPDSDVDILLCSTKALLACSKSLLEGDRRQDNVAADSVDVLEALSGAKTLAQPSPVVVPSNTVVYNHQNLQFGRGTNSGDRAGVTNSCVDVRGTSPSSMTNTTNHEVSSSDRNVYAGRGILSTKSSFKGLTNQKSDNMSVDSLPRILVRPPSVIQDRSSIERPGRTNNNNCYFANDTDGTLEETIRIPRKSMNASGSGSSFNGYCESLSGGPLGHTNIGKSNKRSPSSTYSQTKPHFFSNANPPQESSAI